MRVAVAGIINKIRNFSENGGFGLKHVFLPSAGYAGAYLFFGNT